MRTRFSPPSSCFQQNGVPEVYSRPFLLHPTLREAKKTQTHKNRKADAWMHRSRESQMRREQNDSIGRREQDDSIENKTTQKRTKRLNRENDSIGRREQNDSIEKTTQ